MTLRTKVAIYLVALHVILGVVAVVVLINQPMLLFAVELVFVISIAVSYRLVRAS